VIAGFDKDKGIIISVKFNIFGLKRLYGALNVIPNPTQKQMHRLANNFHCLLRRSAS